MNIFLYLCTIFIATFIFVMKQIKLFCMAMLAMLAVACNPIKTVATVDVTVMDQNGKPVEGIMVGRFGDHSSAYLDNADEKHLTNAAGLAHFELKFLEDLGPEGTEEESGFFTFRAFRDNDPASDEKKIEVKMGENRSLTLTLNPVQQDGDE
jgi:hypothetical protein